MRTEPVKKRCVAYFDGQNLFHAVREAYGYSFPNYDPPALATSICIERGWELVETRFYTGVPSAMDRPEWNQFWSAKLAVLGTRGVVCFTRPLRYRNQIFRNLDGSSSSVIVGQEKGIDVRIALDMVRDALDGRYDVCLLFSQDQDFSEAVDDIKKYSAGSDRWVKIVSAFPISPTAHGSRGINGSDWIRIDRRLYDSCIDPRDYRKKAVP
jgi:uncharacterized LabA/DUF88 family protein